MRLRWAGSEETTKLDDLEEDDFCRRIPRFQGENLDRNLALVNAVSGIAGEKGVTPAQLALAWVLRQGEDVVPIPGTKRRRYLEENAHAVEVDLTQADLELIASAFPRDSTSGDRFPDMSAVNG